MVWEQNKQLAQNMYPLSRDLQETFEIAYAQAYQEARATFNEVKVTYAKAKNAKAKKHVDQMRRDRTLLAKKLQHELSKFTEYNKHIPSKTIAVDNPALAGRSTGYVLAVVDADIAHMLSPSGQNILKALAKKIKPFSPFLEQKLEKIITAKLAA